MFFGPDHSSSSWEHLHISWTRRVIIFLLRWLGRSERNFDTGHEPSSASSPYSSVAYRTSALPCQKAIERGAHLTLGGHHHLRSTQLLPDLRHVNRHGLLPHLLRRHSRRLLSLHSSQPACQVGQDPMRDAFARATRSARASVIGSATPYIQNIVTRAPPMAPRSVLRGSSGWRRRRGGRAGGVGGGGTSHCLRSSRSAARASCRASVVPPWSGCARITAARSSAIGVRRCAAGVVTPLSCGTPTSGAMGQLEWDVKRPSRDGVAVRAVGPPPHLY